MWEGGYSGYNSFMPLLDMPLADLRSYRGVNPRPADFDDYWSRALAELDQVNPKVTISDGPTMAPFVKCHDFHFTGVGGARVYAKVLEPSVRSGKGPAVIHFHGYSMSSGDWSGYLGWAAAGFTVAALDVRGQGGRSEDAGSVKGNTLRGHIIRGLDDEPDRLFYRSVYLDCVQLTRLIMDWDGVDKNRVGVTGWSQGGGLSLACAALEPRVRLCAPGYPFLSDYRRVWEMDLAKQAYEELGQWFRRFDPRHEREDAVWERLGYIDVHHLAPRIRAKTLMVTGLMDDVCPPSTQFAAYNAIESEKDMLIYPDFGHEGLPGAHDRIFQFFQGL